MSHKILVIGPLNEGDLAESYARAFERLGMEVVRFDSEVALKRASRFSGNRILRRVLQPALWNAVNREAIAVAEREHPDLVFAVKCAFFHPETVQRIRKSTGAPFVNHYPDHPYLGRRWMPKEASSPRRDLIEVFRQYSIVWMWERSLMQRLQRDGVETRFLPFGVDPELFRLQARSNHNHEGLHCDGCNTTYDAASLRISAGIAALRSQPFAATRLQSGATTGRASGKRLPVSIAFTRRFGDVRSAAFTLALRCRSTC